MDDPAQQDEPDLGAVRRAIDEIDADIVDRLAAREAWVRRAGRLKSDEQSVRAPDRVAEVLRTVTARASEQGATPAVVERIYRGIIGAFVDLELTEVGHHPAERTLGVDLAGRTALVTGSTGGIGLAIARTLARAGARVVVNGRDEGRVQEAAAGLREVTSPDRVVEAAGDVTTAAGAEQVLAAAGEVDVLVNNLGIFGATPALEISDEEWRRYFEVNVLSAVRLTRSVLPGMRERGWGRVVSIASDSAVVIPAEMIHYGTTKTALLSVTRGFAKEMAGTGVTVNAVIAGPTHTEGVETFVRELVGDDLPWDEAQQQFMREHRPQSLLQRLIEPEEIAHLVAYLASPLSSATTGGALRVDGGYVDSILP